MSASNYLWYFGVTEPAIYGITLPKMAIYLFNDWWRCRWFIFDDQQCDSLYNGWFRNFGVLNFINGDDASGMIQSFIAIAIAAVVGFGLTFFFWKDNTVEEEEVIIDKTTIKRKYYKSSQGRVLSLKMQRILLLQMEH